MKRANSWFKSAVALVAFAAADMFTGSFLSEVADQDEISTSWELLRRGINPPEIAPLGK